jgi:hypothetical protein
MFVLFNQHTQTQTMKHYSIAVLFVILFLQNATCTYSREEKGRTARYRPALVSKKGYWVIREDSSSPKRVTVFYYANNNGLVRKETRSRRQADIRRAKVMRSLKKSLAEALDWAEPI